MMDKCKKSTRKQHYVPQFYLRQWTDDSGCFFPIRIEAKSPPKLFIFQNKSNPRRFCYENFFYANRTGQEDKVSQQLEKDFAEAEKVFAKELPRLEVKILNNEKITDQDKYRLSEFMMFMWLRGKQHREQTKKMTSDMAKEINKRLVRFIDRSPKMKARMEEHNLTKQEMIEFADKGEYTVDFGNIHTLRLFKDMYGFCNLISAKYWKVYLSQKGDFITTDSPYSDISLSDKYWGNDFLSREQAFVLSPKILIVARCPKNEKGKKFVRQDITEKRTSIQQLNTHILMRSLRFGFHRDKTLLEELTQIAKIMHDILMKKERKISNN